MDIILDGRDSLLEVGADHLLYLHVLAVGVGYVEVGGEELLEDKEHMLCHPLPTPGVEHHATALRLGLVIFTPSKKCIRENMDTVM